MSRTALLFVALTAVAGGCGRELVDPCAKVAAACVAVQIDAGPGIDKLDAALIHVTGGGIDASKSTSFDKGVFSLPVAVALVFDQVTDTTPVAMNIDVTGLLGGNAVAGGSAQTSIAAATHATVHVRLTPGGAMGEADMGLPEESDLAGTMSDLSPCPTGTHDCSGACVSDTSLDSCGSSCTSCPVGVNATAATCDGTSCGLTCASGFHLCGGACVSSTSTDSCNMSCTPCTPPTGGNATCDGTSCGGACPTNQKLCAGTCIPSAMACNGMCPTGTHDCSGNCFTNDSVNSCGTSCTPCPVPANAMNAVCTGSGMCDFVCNPSYKKCGSTCIPSSGCCTTADCSQPANGTATCNTTTNMCVVTCNSSYVNCNGVCKSITDVSSCGPSCMVCSPPANATATCDGTSCDFTCRTGYVRSGNMCVACGGVGQACCASNACNAPLACAGGVCQPKSLTFSVVSSGTTQPLVAVAVNSLGRAMAGGAAATVQYCPSSSGCGPTTITQNSGDIGGVWSFGSTFYAAQASGLVFSSTSLGPWVYFSPMTPPDPDILGQITGDPSGNLYIVDGAAKVLTYKAATATWAVIPASSTKLQLMHGIWIGGADLYAAGTSPGVVAHGAFARSHDSGTTWQAFVEQNGVTSLDGVWGASNGNVYLVGAGGVVRRVTLSSDTMIAENANDAGSNELFGVFGSNSGGYYYAVGAAGTILRSTGDGVWHAVTSPTTKDLYAVSGTADGSTVWIVGAGGTVLLGQ